jgi:N-acetylmuramoyl-L-alanine amidase
MRSIVISSGHGKYVRGASGYIDEVDEARLIVDEVTRLLKASEATVKSFHDNTSTSQNQNLNTIVNYHNAQSRDLDVSVHLNAYQTCSKAMGTECLYYSQKDLAAKVSLEMSKAGSFINRGAKQRTDLFFLNNTDKPAILLEVCFVDSQADVDLYHQNFSKICSAIAATIGDIAIPVEPAPPTEAPPPVDTNEPLPGDGNVLLNVTGKMSWFGGPEDTGVSASEGLAFIYKISDAPQLFLPYQPEGTTGLARRLNPYTHFVACRWDYNKTPKEMLAGDQVALVRSTKTGMELTAFPADWGPHSDTGRVADLSKSLMTDLGITTDDEVQVIYPYDANSDAES